MNTAYENLEARFRRIGLLGDAGAMLHWDAATTMPAGGAGARAEQLAELQVAAHELLVAPETADALDAADEPEEAWRRANLREMRRRHRMAAALPADLVAAASKAESACEMAWRDARAADDFAGLQPSLQQVLDLARERATALGEALDLAPYDALLERFEGGLRDAAIAPLFDRLAAELPPLIERIRAIQPPLPGDRPPGGPFATAAQRALAERVMAALGFDFERGLLGVSHHPFTGGVPDDVRITTRFNEQDHLESLMAAVHETGHALYQAHLPRDWRWQPVGDSMGMAVHESQSLIVEMQAARSGPCLAWLAAAAGETLGLSGADAAPDLFARFVRHVRPGLIRVDADEVTYPLHIVLRWRLERALLSGDLPLGDLPGAFNDGMQDLLGIHPDSDRDGCLQDIHWPSGGFGYFPTYTLGAIAAAQLFEQACRDEPALPDCFAEGRFAPLTGWLRRHVHAKGRLHPTADDLLIEVTGRGFDVETFLAHLRRRYLEADRPE